MGVVIQLPEARGRAPERMPAPAGASAEILFFLGVSYERMPETVESRPTPDAPPKSGRRGGPGPAGGKRKKSA